MGIGDVCSICPQCRKDIPPYAVISTADEQVPMQKSGDNLEVGIVTCVIMCALFFGGIGGFWMGIGGAVFGLIIGLLCCRKRKHGPGITQK